MTTPESPLCQDGVEADDESVVTNQGTQDTGGEWRAPLRPLEDVDLLVSPKLSNGLRETSRRVADAVTRGSKGRLRTLLAQTVGVHSAANGSSRPTLCATSTGCDIFPETCNDQVTCSRLSKASKSAQPNQIGAPTDESRAAESQAVCAAHETRAAAIPGVQPKPRTVSGVAPDKRKYEGEGNRPSKHPKENPVEEGEPMEQKDDGSIPIPGGAAVAQDVQVQPRPEMNYFIDRECTKLYYSRYLSRYNQSHEFTEDVIKGNCDKDLPFTDERGRWLLLPEYQKMLNAKLELGRLRTGLDQAKGEPEVLRQSPTVKRLIGYILDGSMNDAEEDYDMQGIFVPSENLNKGIHEWAADGSIWVPSGEPIDKPETVVGRVYNADRMRNCVLYAYFNETQLPADAAPIAYHGAVQKIYDGIPAYLKYKNRGLPWLFAPRTEWIDSKTFTIDPKESTLQNAFGPVTLHVANAGQDVKGASYDFRSAALESMLYLIAGRDNKGEFFSCENRDLTVLNDKDTPNPMIRPMPQWHFNADLKVTVNGADPANRVQFVDGTLLGEVMEKKGYYMLHIEEMSSLDYLPNQANSETRRLQRPVTKKENQKGFTFQPPYFQTRFWRLRFPFRDEAATAQDDGTLLLQPIGERYRNQRMHYADSDTSRLKNQMEGWPSHRLDDDTNFYLNVKRIVYSIVFPPKTRTGPAVNQSVNVVSMVDAYELDLTVMHYITVVTPYTNYMGRATSPWVTHELYPNVKLFQIPIDELITLIKQHRIAYPAPADRKTFRKRLVWNVQLDEMNPLRMRYDLIEFGGYYTQLWHLLWLRRVGVVKKMPEIFDENRVYNTKPWNDPIQMEILNSWEPFFAHDFTLPGYSREMPVEYCLQNNIQFRVINVENLLKYKDSIELSSVDDVTFRSDQVFLSGDYVVHSQAGIPLSSEQLITQITLEPGHKCGAIIFDYSRLTMDDFISPKDDELISVTHRQKAKTLSDTTLQTAQNIFFCPSGRLSPFPPRVTRPEQESWGGSHDNINRMAGYYPMIYHYVFVTDELCTGPKTTAPVLFGAINVPHGVRSALICSRHFATALAKRQTNHLPVVDAKSLEPASRHRYHCGELWRREALEHDLLHRRQRVTGIINLNATTKDGTVDSSVWTWSGSDQNNSAIMFFLCPGVNRHKLAVDGISENDREAYHVDGAEYKSGTDEKSWHVGKVFHGLRSSASPMFDLRHGYALTTPYEREKNTWSVKEDNKEMTKDTRYKDERDKGSRGGRDDYKPPRDDSRDKGSRGGRDDYKPPRDDSRDKGSRGGRDDKRDRRDDKRDRRDRHEPPRPRQPQPPTRRGRDRYDTEANRDGFWRWDPQSGKWKLIDEFR